MNIRPLQFVLYCSRWISVWNVAWILLLLEFLVRIIVNKRRMPVSFQIYHLLIIWQTLKLRSSKWKFHSIVVYPLCLGSSRQLGTFMTNDDDDMTKNMNSSMIASVVWRSFRLVEIEHFTTIVRRSIWIATKSVVYCRSYRVQCRAHETPPFYSFHFASYLDSSCSRKDKSVSQRRSRPEKVRRQFI